MSNTINSNNNNRNFQTSTKSTTSSKTSFTAFPHSENFMWYNSRNNYNQNNGGIMMISPLKSTNIFSYVDQHLDEIGHITEYQLFRENAENALEDINGQIAECENIIKEFKSTEIHKIAEYQEKLQLLKVERTKILNDIRTIDDAILADKYAYITTTEEYKNFTENYDPYNPKIKDYDDLVGKYYFYGETGLEMHNEYMKNKDNDLILNEVDKIGERSLEIYEQVCNDLGYNLKSEDIDKFAVVDYLIKTRVKEGNETIEDVLLYFESVELINNDGRVLGTLSDYYSVMTEEERNLYHYIFAEYGESDANDYLESIENSVNQRIGMVEATKFIAELDVNDKEQLEISLCNLFGVSKEGLGDGVANWFAGIDENSVNSPTLTPLDYKKMYVLDFLSKNGNGEILFNLGYDNVYQLSTSIGNMLPPMAISTMISLYAVPIAGSTMSATVTKIISKFPKIAGNVAMFCSTAGNAQHEALVGGSEMSDARLYGLLTGLSETTLGYFLGGTPLSGYDKGFLGNLFGEMLEEALQVPISNGFKTVVLNEDVDWSTLSDEMLTSAAYAAVTSIILGGPGNNNNEFSIDTINNKTKLDAAIITDGEITVTLGEVMEKAQATGNYNLGVCAKACYFDECFNIIHNECGSTDKAILLIQDAIMTGNYDQISNPKARKLIKNLTLDDLNNFVALNYNESYYKDFEKAFGILEEQYGRDNAIIMIQNVVLYNNFDSLPEDGNVRDIIKNMNETQFTFFMDRLLNPDNEVIIENFYTQSNTNRDEFSNAFSVLEQQYGKEKSILLIQDAILNGNFDNIPAEVRDIISKTKKDDFYLFINDIYNPNINLGQQYMFQRNDNSYFKLKSKGVITLADGSVVYAYEYWSNTQQRIIYSEQNLIEALMKSDDEAKDFIKNNLLDDSRVKMFAEFEYGYIGNVDTSTGTMFTGHTDFKGANILGALGIKNLSFLEKFRDPLGLFGTDQAITKTMDVWGTEYRDMIINKLIDKGMDEKTAVEIIRNLNNTGACSYASCCDEIFNAYKDRPDAFYKDFGFSMYYKDNYGNIRLNSAELLTDLYLFVNTSNNKLGGTLFKEKNGKIEIIDIDKSSGVINTKNQVYLCDSSGRNSYAINKYLKSKNPNLKYNSNMIINTKYDCYGKSQSEITPLSMQEVHNLKLRMSNALLEGNQISISFWDNPNSSYLIRIMYENGYVSTDTKSWGGTERAGGGHSVFVTGITDSTIEIVTWGGIFYIPFEDLRYMPFNITVSEIGGIK